MTETATLGDPVQAQVEATLRRVLADVTALPCHLSRSLQRRVEQPVAVVRTLVSLALNTVLGQTPFGNAGGAPRADDTAPPPLTGRSSTNDRPTAAAATVDLPIDDYESLAASQVVSRLERLDPEALAVIEEFELAHRGRRTILGKIEQLRASR